MTLRDKIAQCPDQQGWTNPNYGRAENLEKIADDYALDFAYWVIENRAKNILIGGNQNIKQLLEIFKKEKGL